jgi:hypothetical protein
MLSSPLWSTLPVKDAPAPGYNGVPPRRHAAVVQPNHWQTNLHDVGTVLDFKEKTTTIDEILLPMRNINNLQIKPSISRALKQNPCLAQEPVSTRNTTKRVVEILDAKYDKADLPSIIKNNCTHLSTSHCNSLFALLLKFEELFDGMLKDWKLRPVSFELKGGAKQYNGRP